MYLFEMDDVLEEFVDDAAQEGHSLDYSLGSLPALEAFWLAKKSAPDAERFFQRSVRYLGEVFRKNVGGKWKLSLDEPRDMYYKLPVIFGYSTSQPHLQFCPLFIFKNFTIRQRPGMLRKAVDTDRQYL